MGGVVDFLDAVGLELFNHRFASICEEMGAVLGRTAISPNIKERRDFSCAIFDGAGQLVANAPHIPVHLGSMSDSVRSVLSGRTLKPGESWMLNDPYQGGTHLPDMTVVTPFFFGEDSEPLFVLASRAHHADVGGITPGSMPATSRSIHEEGVRFEPFLLVSDGQLREQALLAALRERGAASETLAWDDPRADWAAFDACLIRTTWDRPSGAPRRARAASTGAASRRPGGTWSRCSRRARSSNTSPVGVLSCRQSRPICQRAIQTAEKNTSAMAAQVPSMMWVE